MVKVTNYAVQKSRDGTNKVFLEVTGEKEFLSCKYTGKFLYVIPRCIVPSVLDEQRAKKLIGTIATGQIKKLFVEPYEVVHWPSNNVYSLMYKFGFKPNSMKEIIGITPVNSADIQLF